MGPPQSQALSLHGNPVYFIGYVCYINKLNLNLNLEIEDNTTQTTKNSEYKI